MPFAWARKAKMHRKSYIFQNTQLCVDKAVWPFRLFLAERLTWNFHPVKHTQKNPAASVLQLFEPSFLLSDWLKAWRPLKVRLWLSPHSFIRYGPVLVSTKYLPGGCWVETFASNNFSACRGHSSQMWNVTRHEHVRKRNGRVSKGGKYFRQHYLTYRLHFVLRLQLKYLTNCGP